MGLIWAFMGLLQAVICGRRQPCLPDKRLDRLPHDEVVHYFKSRHLLEILHGQSEE